MATAPPFQDPDNISTLPARMFPIVAAWVRAEDLLSKNSTTGERNHDCVFALKLEMYKNATHVYSSFTFVDQHVIRVQLSFCVLEKNNQNLAFLSGRVLFSTVCVLVLKGNCLIQTFWNQLQNIYHVARSLTTFTIPMYVGSLWDRGNI